jgi:hypothetical protein
VKPDERPQQLTDWLATFGKVRASDESENDESTRFFAKQVETDDIVPVPPTPDVERKAPVETRVPANPKEVQFKRAGEETSAARKLKSDQDAAEKQETLNRTSPVDAAAESPAAIGTGKPAPTPVAEPGKKKPSIGVLAGVAGAVVLVAGVGAMTLGGGSPGAGPPTQSLAEATAGTIDLSADGTANATDQNAVAEVQEPTETGVEPDEDAATTATLRRDAARAAAAEARLKALEKATAKSRTKTTAEGDARQKKTEESDVASASTVTQSASGKAVSSAQLSQFYSTVDEGRRMAKKVIRSQSGQNAQLASNYDSYLKSLRASMRRTKSEKEADALIKQARLYRAYIQTLDK